MPSPRPLHAVIIGAGPAGLTAAYELLKHDVGSTVVEKDPSYVGGIARTAEHHGYRFDIGGHRFFSKSAEIEELWSEVLGDEMRSCGRLSRIHYRGRFFDYPLKATNALRNLGLSETVLCMLSYAAARLRPVKHPRTLEEWVSNQFGKRLFRIFFKTYTEKVWGMDTSELSADWAAQRISGLNLTEVIRNALLPKRKGGGRGGSPKTLVDRFRYPRLGPGQMWETVARTLQDRGQQVVMGVEVVRVNHLDGRVVSVTTRDPTGAERDHAGSDFISTMPIRELVDAIEPPMPARVIAAASALRYRDFLTVALMVGREEVFPDNWLYIHDPGVQVGRLQNFKNWSADMVPDQATTCIGLEYFCFEGDGLWTSSDEALIELGGRELEQLGICSASEIFDGAVVRQPKAYPVYDDLYLTYVDIVRNHLATALPNLHLVGRNGMHHYNNQDHSMMTALLVARNIATGSRFDQWKVNTDAEYHEEASREDAVAIGRQVPTRLSPD
jgi:protoporphyrinogen oxidase